MCTTITLKAKDGSYVQGRTNEFATYYRNDIRFYSRKQKTANALFLKKTKEFNNKYAFFGINVGEVLGKMFDIPDLLTDGLNEAGLSASTHFYPGNSCYKEVDELKETEIDMFGLVNILLGQFKTIAEVTKFIEKNQGNFVIKTGALIPAHMYLLDKEGNSVALEPDEKGFLTISKTNGIFTNSPNYKYHLKNLSSYANIQQFDLKNPSILTDENDQPVVSHGISGAFGLPGDTSPNSRFIKGTYLRNAITKENINTSEEAVLSMFRIMNNFDIIPGMAVKEMGEAPIDPNAVPTDFENTTTGHTDHTLVKDLNAGRIYYKDWTNQSIRYVDFTDYDMNLETIPSVKMIEDQAITAQKIILK